MPKRTPMSERIVRVKVGIDLPVDLAVSLDDWCRDNRVRKNLVAELALRRFLAEKVEAVSDQ